MSVQASIPSTVDRRDRILDRVADAAHPLYGAWCAGCANPLPEHWAVAHNVGMDARVDDPDRAMDLCAELAVQLQGGSLNDGLAGHLHHVYRPPFPTWRFAGKRQNLPGHRRLFHVDSSSSLMLRLTAATGIARFAELEETLRRNFGAARLLPAHGNLSQPQVDVLATQINTLEADDFRALIADLLLLSPPRGVWWAALADETEVYRENPNAMVSALGLGVYADGIWLLAYNYSAEKAGLVYRPTAFEAADYAFHFPSPVSLLSGLTMPLDDVCRPCAEFVHHALAPLSAAEHVEAKLMRIDGWSADGTRNYEVLPQRRQRHWTFLRKRAPDDLAWAKRHQWRDEERVS